MKTKKKRSYDDGVDISETGRIILHDMEDRGKTSTKKKKKKKDEPELSLDDKRENNRVKGKFEVDKKKKKKTVGDLIRKGKTKGIERKLDRFEAKAMQVMARIAEDEPMDLPAQFATAGEQDFFNEFNTIFATTQKILRSLETKMLNAENGVSSKDVYALCTLYSNMRETIGDMRSIKDMQAQAQEIENVIFAPLAKAVASHLVDFYQRFNRDLILNVKNPELRDTMQALLKALISETSTKIKDEFGNSSSRVVNVLSGG